MSERPIHIENNAFEPDFNGAHGEDLAEILSLYNFLALQPRNSIGNDRPLDTSPSNESSLLSSTIAALDWARQPATTRLAFEEATGTSNFVVRREDLRSKSESRLGDASSGTSVNGHKISSDYRRSLSDSEMIMSSTKRLPPLLDDEETMSCFSLADSLSYTRRRMRSSHR